MSGPVRRAALILTCVAGLSACTGGPTPAGSGPSVPPGGPGSGSRTDRSALPAIPAPAGSPAAAAGVEHAAGYSPTGQRDPFEAFAVPRRAAGEGPRSAVSSARLAGIIRSDRGDLALLEAPDGAAHILRAGDELEGRRLIEIGADSVVMEGPRRGGASSERMVLRMEATR